MKREPKSDPALLLAPLFSRSLTLVPRSFLLNRTETLATQASPSPSLVYRVNITTFFNLPDMSLMFRRYIRHLQCYIMWNCRWIWIARDVTKFVTLRWQYWVLKSWRLPTYKARVRFTCFTCWLRFAFSHFFSPLVYPLWTNGTTFTYIR